MQPRSRQLACRLFGAGDKENADPNQRRTACDVKKGMLKRKIEGESISTPDLSPLGHYNNDNIVKDLSGCGYAV